MLDVVIGFFVEIGQVLLDLWIEKVVNRFRKKKKNKKENGQKEDGQKADEQKEDGQNENE